MPETYNYFGTGYVGRREQEADGSYITTEFTVFFDIPIMPLGSYRVRPTGKRVTVRRWLRSFESEEYEVRPVPLHWRQIANVYLGTFVLFATVLLTIALIALSVGLGSKLLDYLRPGGSAVPAGILMSLVLALIALVIFVIMRITIA